MTHFTRRDFLKIGAAGTATAILSGCAQESERWVELEPYVNAPEEQLAGLPTWYASTCRLCPAGCGIIARVMNGRAVKLEGNPEHPVNRGKLCARGQSGLQLLYNPDRVTGAVRQESRGNRRFTAIPWNEAINTLYERLEAAGSQVAVWTGSSTPGHLSDLFARFTDAVGAEAPVHYDLYTGLGGYGALAAASETMFDSGGLPVYDISRADTIFSFGADFVGMWLSPTGYGVDYGQFRSQASGRRGYMVQFEPKMTITGAKADRWVPVRPGAEALVAQALVRIIADEGFGSDERVERAGELAGEVDLEEAAAACEMSVEGLVTLARAFAVADRPVAIPGGTLSGGSHAVSAIMAVQALNVIAGNTGQPGGLRLSSAVPDLAAPAMSSLTDIQSLIERMNNGQVRLLLIHGANPVYDLPDAAGLRAALEQVETVISFSPLVDETSVYADFIFPDRVYLEGWGYQVVQPSFNGIPVLSSQQPVVAPLHDIRATADVLLTASKGIPAAAGALPWTDEVAFIREVFSTLPTGAVGGDDGDVRWARFLQHGGWWAETPDSEVPEPSLDGPIEVSPAAFQGDEGEYPYFLNLYLSVLLGDGSGASLPWLQGSPDPLTTVSWQTWVELNPRTAEELEVEFGDILKIESPYGEIEAPAYIFPAIRPDTVSIPVGQGHSDYGRYARNRGANPVRLLGMEPDETGSQLSWSNVRVKISKTGKEKVLARFESTVEHDEEDELHIPL